MKKNPNNRACLALAILAAAACCGTARADIGTVFTSTNIVWPAESNPMFYSATPLTPLTSLSGDIQPGAAAGATATSLSETFTITNGAGVGAGGSGPGYGTNYVLTGIGMVVSGYSTTVPCTLHIYDVTTNLVSNNGTKLNGSGASYNLFSTAQTGDLLGEGQGLPFWPPVTPTRWRFRCRLPRPARILGLRTQRLTLAGRPWAARARPIRRRRD